MNAVIDIFAMAVYHQPRAALFDKKIIMENKLSVGTVMGPWQGVVTT
jgi:hypothetical protein